MTVDEDDTRPAVSVVIPCFRQAFYLAGAIDSVLDQLGPNLTGEVIVVDDGSPDDPAAVVAPYGSRVRHVRQANGGVSAARNTGIRAAAGRWLLFLDADDWLVPGALARLLAAAAADPAVAVVCGGWQESVGGTVEDQRPPAGEPQPPPAFTPDPFHALMVKNLAPIHSFLVRRDVFDTVEPFEVGLACHEDWDVWLRIAAAGFRFATSSGPVGVYRHYPHLNSGSGNQERVVATFARVLRKAGAYHAPCPLCRTARERALDNLCRLWVRGMLGGAITPAAARRLDRSTRVAAPNLRRRLVRTALNMGVSVVRSGRAGAWFGRLLAAGRRGR